MQELLTHALTPNVAFSDLEDGGYPLVLETRKLVQLQIKVVNLFASVISLLRC